MNPYPPFSVFPCIRTMEPYFKFYYGFIQNYYNNNNILSKISIKFMYLLMNLN